ncbi:MAG: hypothetical protein J5I94_20675 [Phaeodactylibacter sp.]|nr:hypothetical protein [Phaeodactylibacter sp.]
MKKLLLLFAVFAAFSLALTSCQKEEAEDPAIEEGLVTDEDVTTASNLFQDTEDEVDYQIETRGGGLDCPTVTITPDDGAFPRTVEIDFGPDGCEGPNGRIRQGMIIVNQTAPMPEPGATRTITFDNFFVDGVQVQGVKTITNQSAGADGNSVFTRTITGGSLTFPNGGIATWEASHTLTQVAGGETPIMIDNIFEITGGSSGVNRNGVAFTAEITSPLVKRKNCRWLVAGVKTITVNNRTRTLEYGDGECDRIATVTYPNGFSREVLIRNWWRL